MRLYPFCTLVVPFTRLIMVPPHPLLSRAHAPSSHPLIHVALLALWAFFNGLPHSAILAL